MTKVIVFSYQAKQCLTLASITGATARLRSLGNRLKAGEHTDDLSNRILALSRLLLIRIGTVRMAPGRPFSLVWAARNRPPVYFPRLLGTQHGS